MELARYHERDPKPEATLDALYRALEQRNPSLAVRAYAKKNVMFSLAPPLQNVSWLKIANANTGSNPGEGSVREWLDTFSEGPTFKVRDQHVEMDGDLAVVYSLVHMGGRKKGGADSDMWYRETNCLHKTDDGWKIFHQHQSVPFSMDGSFRALTDLKPEI